MLFTASALVVLSLNATVTEKNTEDVARERFKAATALYSKKRYREAIAEFEAVHALKPHGAFLYNLAKSHQRLNEHGKSLWYFSDYLRMTPGATDKSSVELTMSGLERALQKNGVQQLRCRVSPERTMVSIDGVAQGEGPLAVELSPGEHHVVFQAAGHRALELDVALDAARSQDLTVELEPMSASVETVVAGPPPSLSPSNPVGPASALALTPASAAERRGWSRTRRTFIYGSAAGTAIAVVTGLIAGSSALSSQNTLRGGLHSQQGAQQLHDGAVRSATVANVSYVSAGVLGATALVLFLTDPAGR